MSLIDEQKAVNLTLKKVNHDANHDKCRGSRHVLAHDEEDARDASIGPVHELFESRFFCARRKKITLVHVKKCMS